jgi:arginine/lysine/ornithine decarboxylase
MLDYEYISPTVVTTPQEAFYSEKSPVALRDSLGRVCAETVMSYPPGIPILSPGERVTREIIDYILYAKEKGCFLTGTEDLGADRLNVVKDSC